MSSPDMRNERNYIFWEVIIRVSQCHIHPVSLFSNLGTMKWEKGAARSWRSKVTQPDKAERYQAPRQRLGQWASLMGRVRRGGAGEGGRTGGKSLSASSGLVFVKTSDKVWGDGAICVRLSLDRLRESWGEHTQVNGMSKKKIFLKKTGYRPFL